MDDKTYEEPIVLFITTAWSTTVMICSYAVLTTHNGHKEGVQLLHLTPIVRIVRVAILESDDLLGNAFCTRCIGVI